MDGREFHVLADVSELLDQHGDGVYTVVLLASLEGSSGEPDTVISEYSIFHGVRVPEGYGPLGDLPAHERQPSNGDADPGNVDRNSHSRSLTVGEREAGW